MFSIPSKPNRKASVVLDTLGLLFAGVRHRLHTITVDNGTLFAEQRAFTKALGVQCRFAHPYASRQRGANQNASGLRRRYFPKGCDLAAVTTRQPTHTLNPLNSRPRKCLGIKPPVRYYSVSNHLTRVALHVRIRRPLQPLENRLGA